MKAEITIERNLNYRKHHLTTNLSKPAEFSKRVFALVLKRKIHNVLKRILYYANILDNSFSNN